MFMCVAVNLMESILFAADITNAVGPLTSVPGIADKLPSESATPAFLPVGNAPVTKPHQVVDTLGISIGCRFDVFADVITSSFYILECLVNRVIYPAGETVHFGNVVTMLWEPRNTFYLFVYILLQSWLPALLTTRPWLFFYRRKPVF